MVVLYGSSRAEMTHEVPVVRVVKRRAHTQNLKNENEALNGGERTPNHSHPKPLQTTDLFLHVLKPIRFCQSLNLFRKQVTTAHEPTFTRVIYVRATSELVFAFALL